MTPLRRNFLCELQFALVFLILSVPPAHAIPAFARKYGLRCSACHVAWPVLNDFGWRFKDNGYQLMNDRDAPIWQHPSYWPVTFRSTPNWHLEKTNRVAVDVGSGLNNGQVGITQHGFDLSGLDILTGGTLEKNISFLLTPSSDNTGTFHFESAWVRLDNLLHSPWFNFRFGKFELDNFISEKRTLTLSAVGGIYQLYHFVPPNDVNTFGQVGDNQLGIEWQGHSFNDRTRLSAALFSSNDGNVNLQNANTYSGFFNISQAFDLGGLGQQRVGAYYFIGQAPTYSLTSAGVPIPGSSLGNKSFNREGLWGDFFIYKFEVPVYFQHGSDNPHFAITPPGATSPPTPANVPLPPGARAPTWNGFFIEPRFIVSPQLVLFQRTEIVRMSQQALRGTIPSNLGDLNVYTLGYRWYPIMTSRAGFAFHNEYSRISQRSAAPDGTDLTSSSVFVGFDFDF
jgi:hypothetical protein